MKWITRSHVHVDRVACPWLITRFIDIFSYVRGMDDLCQPKQAGFYQPIFQDDRFK